MKTNLHASHKNRKPRISGSPVAFTNIETFLRDVEELCALLFESLGDIRDEDKDVELSVLVAASLTFVAFDQVKAIKIACNAFALTVRVLTLGDNMPASVSTWHMPCASLSELSSPLSGCAALLGTWPQCQHISADASKPRGGGSPVYACNLYMQQATVNILNATARRR